LLSCAVVKPANKYVNLVFQGGGVRGIAYAGVLAKKPSHVVVYAAAGTSAGSIVAALLALGKSAEEIKAILERDDLRSLVAENELQRMERLQRAWQELKGVWITKKNGKGKVSLRKALWFATRHKEVFSDIRDMWAKKGLHSSDKLGEFLEKLFQGKTYADLKVDDLKIVAANVNRQKYEIYSKANPPKTIADAVRASVSIPIFFEPFILGANQFAVDGGLLSNYPSFLFAQGFYPTIGFRLVDLAAPSQIDSTASYLKALILTMTDAHDKLRGDPPDFTSYPIPTPTRIPSTKFALTEDDVKELHTIGTVVGESVHWDTIASETRKIQFYDPQPHKALKFSLEQAHKLFNVSLRSPVDVLRQETTFSVFIGKDWSTTYSMRNTLQVEGPKQLFLTRFIGSSSSTPNAEPLSLIDFKFVAKEVTANKSDDLIRIPAYNMDREKGFLIFYAPPLAAGPARTFQTQFEIPREFENTLGKGLPDTVEYSVQALADRHSLKLTFEILPHIDLPDLTFDAPLKDNFQEQAGFFDKESKMAHRRFSTTIETDVKGTAAFEVKLDLKVHS
jgi:NTE family protein